MSRSDLSDLAAFAAIAAHGSFRRAAGELGVSTSALSHAVRGLEERLGVRLLNRTSRSVAPSAAGERLLAHLRPALDSIAAGLEEVSAARDRPGGMLRLNVPRLAAMTVLAPALLDFVTAYPDVQLEVTVEDGLADIVAGRYDAGIRFGESIARDMVAVRVSPEVAMAVVGSPAYFATRSAPLHPRDLQGHACLRYRMRTSGALYAWEFERDGEPLEVAVEGALTLDDQELMVHAALGGAGLAYTSEPYVKSYLQDGRLVRVLADWCPPFPGFFLYYPSRRQMPSALRALIEAIRVRR